MSLVATVKSKIPWWAKIGAKVVLSRLPIKYKYWRRMAMFQLGQMEQPAYAYTVFRRHYDRLKLPAHQHGFTMLEVGPGDSVSSAMVAHALGASASYLIDVGAFARSDVKPYRVMATFLQEQGLVPVRMDNVNSVDELLRLCHASYGTSGVGSLRAIPDQSIDLVWSQDVLEHIRRAEFPGIVRELHRVVRREGICSHHIDLKDHLGGALNNLRFRTPRWESEFLANAGFYTNRIRYSEMLDLFQQAGFDIEVVAVERWKSLPTPREKLASEFGRLSNDELCVSGFDVILRRR